MSISTALYEVKKELGGACFPLCESPSLRHDKYLRIGDDVKGEELAAVVECHERLDEGLRKIAPKSMQIEPRGAEQFIATLQGRLIVNQAGGILENAGLCLHPHFGIPYIPGSAIKGVARHAAWCEWKAAFDDGDDERALATAEDLAKVFGYPTENKALDDFLTRKGWEDRRARGTVGFLAAVPVDKTALVVDIVNCHHMKYYSGGRTVATDDEEPNPQTFLAVEKGAKFRFTIVPLRDECPMEQARKWLTEAITVFGLGAKTSAGYGWFEKKDESLRPDPEKVEFFKNLSATKFKKWLSETGAEAAPIEQRSALEALLAAAWWEKERKNKGSKITKLITEWIDAWGER